MAYSSHQMGLKGDLRVHDENIHNSSVLGDTGGLKNVRIHDSRPEVRHFAMQNPSPNAATRLVRRLLY